MTSGQKAICRQDGRRLAAALAVILVALFAVGCATTNDAGIVLQKRPDLSKVTPGTPVSKVASLKKPIKREVITKGELKGAEAWLYEWDAPNDEVNNKMFTSVVVKDGVILGYAEDTPDKWRKDSKLYEAAKLASSWENIGGYMAKAARYQMVADMFANSGSSSSPYVPARSYARPSSAYSPALWGQAINTSTRLANVYDSRGELAGSVNRRGQLLDSRGELAGSVNRRGQILDARGDLAGSLNDRGQVLDSRGEYSGFVR
jgi:hypothetical protein